jgi:hypothetical protein
MRRAIKIVARILLCTAIAFATVVAGLVVHDNFSWRPIRA